MDDTAATGPEREADAPAAAPTVTPVDLRDYADFRRGPATRVRVFTTGRLAVDLWCLEPGSSSGVQHLPDDDVVYTVIGGRPWFVTDDGEVGLDPMGALLVPADTVHGIDNRMPDPVIVLALVAPGGGGDADVPSEEADAVAAAVRWGEDQTSPIRRAVERLLGTGRG